MATLALPWATADAQKAVTLYWTHGAQTGGEVLYRLPGDDAGRRRGGLEDGGRLNVRKGGRVCFQIVQANPLLYTYAAGSQVLTVSAPDELGSVLSGIQAVVTGLGVKAGPPATLSTGATPADDLERLRKDSTQNVQAWTRARAYAERLQSMLDTLKALEDLKTSSDAYAFDTVLARSRGLRRGLEVVSRAANDARGKAEEVLGKDERILSQLRALQDLTDQRFAARYAEFEEAAKRLSDPLCATIDKDRVRLSLTTKARGVEGAKLERVAKENVVAIELDPQSDKAFEIAPGVLLGVNVDRPRFSLSDNVVQTAQTSDLIARPALFALGRLWPLGWLWAGIGASKGATNVPDAFFGMVARPGLSLVETQLSVGVGLGLYQVPDRLREGQVGQPLPANIENLEDNVVGKAKAGLAITVNISGLKFGETPK